MEQLGHLRSQIDTNKSQPLQMSLWPESFGIALSINSCFYQYKQQNQSLLSDRCLSSSNEHCLFRQNKIQDNSETYLKNTQIIQLTETMIQFVKKKKPLHKHRAKDLHTSWICYCSSILFLSFYNNGKQNIINLTILGRQTKRSSDHIIKVWSTVS